MTRTFLCALIVGGLVILACATRPAQAKPPMQASEDGVVFAQLLGEYCIGKWGEPNCLKSVSQMNLTMVGSYGGGLQERGQTREAENIKQHCAASTAATEGDYPAYAMKSAFIECANAISDANERTGLQPDLTMYQLLVGAVMCIDGNAACAKMEETLRQFTPR